MEENDVHLHIPTTCRVYRDLVLIILPWAQRTLMVEDHSPHSVWYGQLGVDLLFHDIRVSLVDVLAHTVSASEQLLALVAMYVLEEAVDHPVPGVVITGNDVVG